MRSQVQRQTIMTATSTQVDQGAHVAAESIIPEDDDAFEFKSNGLRLEMAPFQLEHIQDYRPGGHHPIHLGDVLGRGYHVIHKLGSGGFATVWLGRNHNVQNTTQYVALKVIRAEASGDECPELVVSQLIPSESSELDERKHGIAGLESICLPMEHFKIEGPNGTHLCFVYPVLGLRVSHGAFRNSDDLDKILLQVCYKVTAGLSSFHAEGICHGGKNHSTPF